MLIWATSLLRWDGFSDVALYGRAMLSGRVTGASESRNRSRFSRFRVFPAARWRVVHFHGARFQYRKPIGILADPAEDDGILVRIELCDETVARLYWCEIHRNGEATLGIKGN